MPFEHFLSLLQHSSGKSSRSTTLQPLVWLIIVVAGVFMGAAKYIPGSWIPSAVLGLIALVVLAFIGAFMYFMVKNPDALRSERFTLDKMALQQSRTGDDISGFKERPLIDETAKVVPQIERSAHDSVEASE
ncbi:MAG: hypothetical protein ACR2JE_17400 [Acidobacteriaceae bacterium]